MKSLFVIGVDEVGRGALAGPVVVVAALVKCRVSSLAYQAKKNGLGALKDSKKLSAQRREAWYAYFKNNPDVVCAVARVYPRGIERMNISRAANLAAQRALVRLTKNSTTRNRHSDVVPAKAGIHVVLDGGLYVGNGRQPKNAKTVVRADEKIFAVAVASIIAKVTRDRYMTTLAGKYPAYGFEIHKGYGTKRHYAALKKHGSSEAHRLTFLGQKVQ